MIVLTLTAYLPMTACGLTGRARSGDIAGQMDSACHAAQTTKSKCWYDAGKIQLLARAKAKLDVMQELKIKPLLVIENNITAEVLQGQPE